MTSWSRAQHFNANQRQIRMIYDSEDNNIINLNFINTSIHPDSDISIIVKKTSDYNTAIVDTITLDNSFSPYTLYINSIPFIIKSYSQSIKLFQINQYRKLLVPNIQIPKTIIQTWNTKDIENTDLYYQVKVIKALNPDYNYVLFDELERQTFIRDNYDKKVYDAYMKLKPPTYRTDLWRYCYLYKFGGIYMDFKFIVRKSFNSLINENTKLLMGKAMFNDGINPGFLICLPNESLLKRAIDLSVERIETNYYGLSSLDITGPLMFEQAFKDTYNLSSSEYIDKQNNQIKMGRYDDINNHNCILFNNTIFAHNGFSTYYTKYRTSPYIVFWNNKDVYNIPDS